MSDSGGSGYTAAHISCETRHVVAEPRWQILVQSWTNASPCSATGLHPDHSIGSFSNHENQ
jgi:hypothetical protein